MSKKSAKPVTSALPRLLPIQIVDKQTGELLEWEDYQKSTLHPLLEWAKSETERLYNLDPKRVQEVAGSLRYSPAEHARAHGLVADSLSLPRAIKAKSRIDRLIQHKLMSETSAYVRNPNPRKQEHAFSTTINLGSVDKQMCILEREDNQLFLHWKCWDKELMLTFNIPSYLHTRNITKWSLPMVSNKGFVFSIQEQPPAAKGENIAGVDLGRVEPFTLVITNPVGGLVAEYRARPQLRATNRKRERLLAEIKYTRAKAIAYESLGLNASNLREQVRLLKNKSRRIGEALKNEVASDITRKTTRHEVSLLRLEDLRWASGQKYGSRWNHGRTTEKTEHSLARAGVRSQRVNPRGSSQHCHKCGNAITHITNNRTVRCAACQSVLDRDVNAALNIAKNRSYPVTRMLLAGITGNAVATSVAGISTHNELKPTILATRLH